MEKRFFDVFPDLKVDPDIRGWLEEAVVTRVTCSQDRTLSLIHI